MSFWKEVFSDDRGRGSSQRVFNGFGVLVGGIVVLWLTFKGTLGEGIFGLFLLATGGVYGFGQWKQSQVEIEKIKAENPQPAPPPITALPLGPTTVIQVGQGDKSNESGVKDVNIKADGDVNVKSNK